MSENESSTRVASLDDLFKKRRRTSTVVIESQDDDGGKVSLELHYRAIGSREYDDLVARFPPTAAQKKESAQYNVDLFAPALIAAVCVEPALSMEDAKAIYSSPEWSGGEIGSLFLEALKLCQSGLDVSFTANG